MAMFQYAEEIPRAIWEPLGEQLEQAKTPGEKWEVLKRSGLPEFRCSPEEGAIFVDFLTLLIPNEPFFDPVHPKDKRPPVREQVAVLNENAMRSLASSISSIGLQVNFMQGGKEVILGTREMSEAEMEALYPTEFHKISRF